MKSPKVSILVAAFNVDRWLHECLTSIANLSFQDFECIIVDDGSTDSTPAIASRFAEADGRFKLLTHSVNRGLPQTRKTGLLNSSGEYVWYIDGDDYVDRNGLGALVKVMDRDGCDIARGRFQSLQQGKVTAKNATTNTPAFSNCTFPDLYTYVSVNSIWLNIFRRSFLDEYPVPHYPELNLGEDLIYCSHTLTNARKISVSDQLIYTYRNRELSYTKADVSKRRYLEEARSHLICFENLKKHPVVALDFVHRFTSYRKAWVENACKTLPKPDATEVIDTYKKIYNTGFDTLGYAMARKNRAMNWNPKKNTDEYLFGTFMRRENTETILQYYRGVE